MSFDVDTDQLRKFSEFLDEFGRDAAGLERKISVRLTMTDHGEGLLLGLHGYHDDCVEAMTTRAGVIAEIGNDAAFEIADAATNFYDESDGQAAADLDATYSGATDHGAIPSTGGSSKGGFTYKGADAEWDVDEDDIDGLEPKAGGLEEFVRFLSDRGSYMYYGRDILCKICQAVGLFDSTGGDPISFLIQSFSGDWRAWVECAFQWKTCARVVGQMVSEFDPALVKLQLVWQGKAAEAAVEYFAKLQNAMEVEVETYEHLYEKYKLAAELVYEVQTYINDFVNTICDLAIDLVVLTMTGGATAPGIVVKDVIGAILTLCIVIIQQVKTAETIIQAMSMEDPPACELTKLPGEGKHRLYDHPSESV